MSESMKTGIVKSDFGVWLFLTTILNVGWGLLWIGRADIGETIGLVYGLAVMLCVGYSLYRVQPGRVLRALSLAALGTVGTVLVGSLLFILFDIVFWEHGSVGDVLARPGALSGFAQMFGYAVAISFVLYGLPMLVLNGAVYYGYQRQLAAYSKAPLTSEAAGDSGIAPF